MKRDAVETFTTTLTKTVSRREARDLRVKHLPHDPPPAWVAAAIVGALRRHQLVIRPHICPSGAVEIAYEGPLTVNPCGRQKHLHPYWVHSRADRTRMFVQEASISVGAAARLVNELGYEVANVEIEAEGYGVDGEVFSEPDCHSRVLLGIEAKVSEAELEAMVVGMTRCGGLSDEEEARRAHADALQDAGIRPYAAWLGNETKKGNHHQKCRWLAATAPVGFWAVSGENEKGRSFVAVRDGVGFSLRPVKLEDLRRARINDTIASAGTSALP